MCLFHIKDFFLKKAKKKHVIFLFGMGNVMRKINTPKSIFYSVSTGDDQMTQSDNMLDPFKSTHDLKRNDPFLLAMSGLHKTVYK